jgi:hypothetical protein
MSIEDLLGFEVSRGSGQVIGLVIKKVAGLLLSPLSPLPFAILLSSYYLFLFDSIPLEKMKHVAAYLLLVVGGNASPSVEEVSSVVTACGGEADSAQIEALIAGKDSPTSKIISLFFIFLPCSAAAALVIRFRRKER